MRIGIIGTGVAGSLLAEALVDAPGISVTAYERVGKGEHAEAGTGLNIGPNALKALRLHMSARHAALREASLEWRRWFVDLTDGTRLFDLDMLDVAEEPGLRIRWSELYRLLREPAASSSSASITCPLRVQPAAGRLVPVFRTADGLVRDGAFDLLVGADGRYSRVRALTCGEPEGTLLGVCIWRLLVTDAADCPYDDYGQWFQGNARLLSFRVPGGAVYIAGTFPLGPDGQVDEAMKTEEAQRALYAPPGGSPCPAVAWMLDQVAMYLSEIHWARSATAPLLRHDPSGRALFLGDAAQAMVPTLGQGATQAVECGVVAGTRKKGGPDFLAKLRRTYTEVA